jgi:hypothetical protein
MTEAQRPIELEEIGQRVRDVKHDSWGLDEPITPENVRQLVEDRRKLWIEMMMLESLVADEYGPGFRDAYSWVGDEKDGYTAAHWHGDDHPA